MKFQPRKRWRKSVGSCRESDAGLFMEINTCYRLLVVQSLFACANHHKSMKKMASRSLWAWRLGGTIQGVIEYLEVWEKAPMAAIQNQKHQGQYSELGGLCREGRPYTRHHARILAVCGFLMLTEDHTHIHDVAISTFDSFGVVTCSKYPTLIQSWYVKDKGKAYGSAGASVRKQEAMRSMEANFLVNYQGVAERCKCGFWTQCRRCA